MGKQNDGSLTASHKNRFHRRLKSSTSIQVSSVSDTAMSSRGRIMSLPGSGNEKNTKKEGGGRSLMELLKLKKRRKSSTKSQDTKPGQVKFLY